MSFIQFSIQLVHKIMAHIFEQRANFEKVFRAWFACESTYANLREFKVAEET